MSLLTSLARPRRNAIHKPNEVIETRTKGETKEDETARYITKFPGSIPSTFLCQATIS